MARGRLVGLHGGRRILFKTCPVLMPAAAPMLHQNYPNPFNPSTTIRFDLPLGCPITLDVVDIRGKIIRRLLDGERTSGPHSAVWNGTDDGGRAAAHGLYLYRLSSGKRTLTRKMILVR